MGIKVESQREHTAALLGGDIVIVDIPSVYNNQLQNVFSIKNYGTDTLYVGVNQKISASSGYLVQIAGGGTATLPIPKGSLFLSLFSASACNVLVVSFYTDEIFSNELYQTLSTVIINSTTTSSVNLSAQLPAGTNKIGSFDLASEIPAGTKKIGIVEVDSIPSLPAGNNNIGEVDIASMPALPAGNNNIGEVDIASIPSLPAGNNNIGEVDIASMPSLPAGNNNIGEVDVESLPANSIPAGTPTIYNVTCTNANTEYSQPLPANCKKIIVSIMDGLSSNNYRLAYTAGKVQGPTAPYLKYPQTVEYMADWVYMSGTLYIASSVAGAIAQIECWT